MLFRRIKYAMAHLTHKQYIDLLAQPNWRRTRKMNVHILANPFKTKRAALIARASKRIKVMAKPKHVVKKYHLRKTTVQIKIERKGSTPTISKRILDLALPTKRLLLSNLGFQTSGNITETLWKVQNSRYLKYRYFCIARQQREAKRKQRILARLRRVIKPKDWNRHLEVLERLATPKVPPRPQFIGRKKKWRPYNRKRIEELATPVDRDLPEMRDPFTVSPTALGYTITDRLQQIVYAKEHPERPLPKIPGEVSPGALAAIASPRTIVLAKPAERPAGKETDLREDAFKVSPAALKARCTRRLKLLAIPKSYKR